MKRYISLNTIYSERECDRYKISHKVYKPSFRDSFSSEFIGQKEDDIITVLFGKNKNEVIMSDSVMEKRTNLPFLNKAHGDILIAGLGLGMILLAIQDKPEIKSITVIEIDPDLRDFILIDLKSHLNNKVKIEIADINEYQTNKKFDTIYMDIWNDISGSNIDNMKHLYNKFSKNSDNHVMQWRSISTVFLADGEGIEILSEDEAIEAVLLGLSQNNEEVKDKYEESNFDNNKLYEAIDNNYFQCSCCEYWYDIFEKSDSDVYDSICLECAGE